MTREEAIDILRCRTDGDAVEALEMAIKALEQEPCEDAISREDALMCLTGEIKETDTIETTIARSIRRIRKLPSVKPSYSDAELDTIQRLDQAQIQKAYELGQEDRPTGHWIDAVLPNDNGGLPIQVCDQCNTFFPLAYTGGGHRFCPNCGSPMMVEPQESEDKE